MCSRRSLGPIFAYATALVMVAVLVGAAPVSAAAPGNDDRGSATKVGPLPYRDRPDTSEATAQASDPGCFEEAHTVWYKFTPKRTGYHLARTARPEFWATLTLARVKANGGIEVLQCQDYGWNEMTWRAKAGITYLFMVGAAYGEPGGRVVFRVMKAPKPPSIDIVLTKRPRLTDAGWVRLKGEVRCTGVSHAELFAKVRQHWRRFIIRGFGGALVRCGTTWKMVVTNDLIRFGPGKAKITVTASACNRIGCDSDGIVREVRLR